MSELNRGQKSLKRRLINGAEALFATAETHGPFAVARLRSDYLNVVLGGDGLILERGGQTGELTYREKLVLVPSLPFETGVFTYQSNQGQGGIEERGLELVTNELPVNFVYDLAGYVRHARIGRLHPLQVFPPLTSQEQT